VTPAGDFTSLYSFCSVANCTDGANPVGLILGADGNFYGVTAYGGVPEIEGYSFGTIFKVTPFGQLTTIYTFCEQNGCPDGEQPAALVQTSNGNFYGVTPSGGANKSGTVFALTFTGDFLRLHSFCAQSECADGDGGVSLMEASNGNFYGSSYGGGTYNGGTLFEITPGGKLTTLASVRKPNGMIQVGDNLYGTTAAGGSGSHGIVFELTSAGKENVLHSFCPLNCAAGDSPLSGLALGSDGNFCGSTYLGGITYYAGSVYEITPTGAFSTLYLFCFETNCADGDGAGALMQATNGVFYGTTVGGGTGAGGGTVYRLSTGLGPFVAARPSFGSAGQTVTILGNGLKGTTSVTFNGVAAAFTVASDTYIHATVPSGSTSGTIEVTTPSGTLSSNVAFQVVP